MLVPMPPNYFHETTGRKKSACLLKKINTIVLLLPLNANDCVEPTRPELKEKHVIVPVNCHYFKLSKLTEA